MLDFYLTDLQIFFIPCETDAVKRRTLPAWIREGLEKMEREKQKKLEKERMEQQRSQLSKKEKKTTEDAEGGDGPRLPQRSKFVSRFLDLKLHLVSM